MTITINWLLGTRIGTGASTPTTAKIIINKKERSIIKQNSNIGCATY